MKEIIMHLIDKIFDNFDACLVMMLFFGIFILVPIIVFLGSIIK